MKMSLEQLLEMAKKADQEDRHATAVEMFEAAYNLDPDMSSYMRFRLADSLRIIGRFDFCEVHHWAKGLRKSAQRGGELRTRKPRTPSLHFTAATADGTRSIFALQQRRRLRV